MDLKKGTIGIVGGMGPGAGLDLSSKIISQTLAGSDQEHLSQLLFSLPSEINDRTAFIMGRVNENPAHAIVRVLLQMDRLGVEVAGLACNSAHAAPIFDVILQELSSHDTNIRLLNMIEEVARFIRHYYPGAKRIGILGTTGTHMTRLYDRLEDFGLEVINVTEKEQAKLHSAIYHSEYGIKSVANGEYPKALELLYGACRSLKNRGVELLVFGCTEFPMVHKDHRAEGLPVIDSNMVLARALINAVAPEKLKPWEG